MFNLDCFHFNEIKTTIESIFRYLQDMDSRMDMFEVKQQALPDFEKILMRVKNVEERMPALEKQGHENLD